MFQLYEARIGIKAKLERERFRSWVARHRKAGKRKKAKIEYINQFSIRNPASITFSHSHLYLSSSKLKKMVVYQTIEFYDMLAFRSSWLPSNLFHSKAILVMLWLFLLVFPKGGIKIGDVPMTWGYLVLAIVSLCALFSKSWTFSLSRTLAFLCLVPFQIVAIGSMICNGVAITFGWVAAFLISFLFLPFVFFILLSDQIEKMDLGYFLDLLKKGVTFISYYGIFLFIYKQTTGKFLEIPFLIVNAGDLGMLDDFKCNSRGIVSKLISTYNNGQLFGISVIMLLPIYCYIQKNPWNRFATKLALFLTLSRTTWIGLLLNEILFSLFILKKSKKTIVYLIGTLVFLNFAALLIFNYYEFKIGFLFDESLGGRKGQIEAALGSASLFSDKPFGGIAEMAYMGILETFGLVGLMAYILGMASPLVFQFFKPISAIRTCLLIGLIIYLTVSFSDGATLYIPVLAFYWLLSSLLLRKDLYLDGLATRQNV